ncbi:MAG: hypothetical protein Q9195_004488 [Heterodermia aff. obscurata]
MTPYKNVESNFRDEEYRLMDVPYTQIGEKPSTCNEQPVDSKVRDRERYQEREHSTRETLEPPTAMEVRDEGRILSNKSPPSLEHEKDQSESTLDISKLSPECPKAMPFVIIGISLSVFLVSLDRTIITTAIPHITNEFHSYSDVGWYGSAYLITASVLQLTYGRIFAHFSVKWSYLAAIFIFELGSLVCAVAPNSVGLIVGRAIAGWGSAGILTGSFVLVAHSVPLQKRPAYTGLVGLWFGVGAILGPLLGGVFTDRATWRWCFYFNLPVGAIAVVVIIFFFSAQKATSSSAMQHKLSDLDPVGNIIILGAATMFFLALQLGGATGNWKCAQVVGLLTGAGATVVVFLLWLKRRNDGALVPLSIISQRSVAASCGLAFFIYSTLLVQVYYLPIWFQGIKGDSAVASGIHMIPYMAANALFSLIAGISVTKTGYFAPPAIVGCAISVAGCALLSTLQVKTAFPKLIGYEILASSGLGIAIQQGFIAVQTVLPLEQLPIGTALVTSFQSLGGAVFVSIGNSVVQNELVRAIDASPIPGVDIGAVVSAGATQFRSFVPEAALPALLGAYNHALQKVLIAATTTSGLALFAAFGLEWKTVKAGS